MRGRGARTGYAGARQISVCPSSGDGRATELGAPAGFLMSAVGLVKDERKLPAIAGLVISTLAGAALFIPGFKLCLL